MGQPHPAPRLGRRPGLRRTSPTAGLGTGTGTPAAGMGRTGRLAARTHRRLWRTRLRRARIRWRARVRGRPPWPRAPRPRRRRLAAGRRRGLGTARRRRLEPTWSGVRRGHGPYGRLWPARWHGRIRTGRFRGPRRGRRLVRAGRYYSSNSCEEQIRCCGRRPGRQ